MWSKSWARLSAVLLLVATVLGACDQDEQGRILDYKKGTYLGKADTPLSDDQVKELRLRATQQAGE